MPITKFEELKEDFEKELSSTKNQDLLIQRELEAIKQKITSKPLQDALSASIHLGNFPTITYSESVINHEVISTDYPFQEAFNSFLINDNYEDVSSSDEIVSQAREVAKYYCYLNEKLKVDPKNSHKKTSSLSLKQKLLVISYLNELNLSQINNSQLAKILSQVLDMSEENIRKNLSYLYGGNNEVRTKKNLETVAKLFLDPEFDAISEKIQRDLNKIK